MSSTQPPTSANGSEGTAHPYHYPETPPDGPYRILDQYHSRPNKLRVACAGAGMTGICLAYKIERMLEAGTWELTLFEKNPHFGGTWYENNYPGVACDIPAHLYNFSWDPKPDWSQFYASGAEIEKYIEDFVERNGTRKYMKFNSKIIETKFDEEEGIWNLTYENLQTKETFHDWCHVFINGSGVLNTWQWPDIEGLHSFGGPLIHSANWDKSLDFSDKVVGVIGTGSSSIQIVPALQKKCKEVQVYMRSPTWVSPPFGAGTLGNVASEKGEDIADRQYNFTEQDIKRYRDDPEYHLETRQRTEAEINGFFGIYFKGSEMSQQIRETITTEMNRRMGPGHDELKKFIIPEWAPGCRRISPGDGYLEALVKDNVKPIFNNDIAKIVPEGIVTEDGELHKMDILVCATGFKVAFIPSIRIVNGQGKTLVEDWVDGPNQYLGTSAPRFPNFFTIVGAGSTWGNGTVLTTIETNIEYAIKVIKKMQSEKIKSIAAKQEAVDDMYAHFDEFHKNTVWRDGCRSWYKDNKVENRIHMWTGSTIHFLKTIKEVRYEDYDIKYRYGNRFAFVGNGSVKAGLSNDYKGMSPYIRNSDHEWEID